MAVQYFICTCVLVFATSVSVWGQIDQDSLYLLQEVPIEMEDGLPAKSEEKVYYVTQEVTDSVISLRNNLNVAEAIENLPGVVFKDYGGVGGLKTVSIRGLGAEHTTVSIDGVPFPSGNAGQVDLGRVSTQLVKSIKLHQGFPNEDIACATNYLSANVLELTTVQNKQLPDSSTYQTRVQKGSFGYFNGEGSAIIKSGKHHFFHGGYQGISSEGNYSYDWNNDQIQRKNASYKSNRGEMGWAYTTDQTTLQSRVFYQNTAQQLPGAALTNTVLSNQTLDQNDFLANIRVEHRLKTPQTVGFRYQFSRGFLNYKDPDFLNSSGGLDNDYLVSRHFTSIGMSHALNHKWELFSAVDGVFEKLESTVYTQTALRRNLIGSIGLRGKIERFYTHAFLLSGLFQDQFSDTKSNQTMPFVSGITLGRSMDKNNHFILRTSAKRTFRQPTFSELYFSTTTARELSPEWTTNLNIGGTLKLQKAFCFDLISLTADIFHNEVRDKIVAVPTQNLFVWSIRNIGKVEVNGLEVGIRVIEHIASGLKTSLNINYTLQSARDITAKGSPTYGDQIAYVPYEVLSPSTVISWKQMELSWTALFSGFKYALGENIADNVVPSWSTHDAVLRYTFQKPVRGNFFIQVRNVFDTNYEVIRSFPMPGRNYRLGMALDL